MADEADGRLGSLLGNYRIARVLGRGGMGVVYLGEHVYLGRRVALKVLHASYAGSDEAVGRFLREACAASAISHPNIVEILDFGQAPDGGVFLIMEYLDGDPLHVVLQRERRLDLLRAVNVMRQLCSALGAAHDIGIFHRDLKPENIVLAKRPGRRAMVRRVLDGDDGADVRETSFDYVKILDFGVAKVMEPKPGHAGGVEHETAWAAVSTHADAIFGTPEYMAPEASMGEVADARSEVYAAGVLFYEMLTGTVPFAGGSPIETMFLHREKAPVAPSVRAPDAEITEQAERTILKALSKDPALRHQSMGELGEELRLCYGSVRYRRDDVGAAAPPPPTAEERRPGTIIGGQPLRVGPIIPDRMTLPLGTTAPDPDEDDEHGFD